MDDLVVFHRHDDGPVEMRTVRAERVDHVVVTHVRCTCGSQRAVVSRVAPGEADEVASWAYPRSSGSPREVAS